MRRIKTSPFQTLLAVAFGVAAGQFLPPLAHATTEQENPYFMMEQLGRVLTWIENEYVDPVDRRRLVEGAIKGMVAELDPHSAYLTPEDYAVFQGDTEGKFGGIGVEVDFTDEYVTVIAPIEGSPAELAGIRPGDRILAIDGLPVRSKGPAELVRKMRGDAGTRVTLTIRRSGADKLLNFTLTRQVISVASVASKLLAHDIGYLRIKTFQNGTHAELLDNVAALRAASHGALAGVVLDLRNNPGGLVNEASAVADEFLASGVVFTTRRRGQVVDEVRADPAGALRRGPVVVLVNEYSASAAELLAGALQDNHRAPIVGAPTFGKGSVQTIIDLPGGAGLRLTSLRYYTPSGRAIQAQGIKPDVLIGGASAALGIGVIREQNLEGHLPAVEGARAVVTEPTPPPEDAGAPESEAADGGAGEANLDLGMARDVPEDPETGPDEGLKVAYEIVTGAYAKRARPK
jgi:carboxyl-terminal processing protease